MHRDAPSTSGAGRQPRVQDRVILAQTLALTRADPDYYPLELGNAVLGGSFYATRLSIDLRKNSGLVYSVASVLQAGRTRGVYLIDYASDPQNVVKAASMVGRELVAMQSTPVGDDDSRAKAWYSGAAASEAGMTGMRTGTHHDLGLPLDGPTGGTLSSHWTRCGSAHSASGCGRMTRCGCRPGATVTGAARTRRYSTAPVPRRITWLPPGTGVSRADPRAAGTSPRAATARPQARRA